MRTPEEYLEIFLQPGETYFGDRDTRIRTLLGSCVSITLWHPRHLIGGMCHFMLPRRGHRQPDDALDGRYGDEALELLLREVRTHGTRPGEYETKLFGGGAMFQERASFRCAGVDVGTQNVRTALALMSQHGLAVKAQHLGGLGHRNIIFEIWSGDVWLKHVTEPADPVLSLALSA